MSFSVGVHTPNAKLPLRHKLCPNEVERRGAGKNLDDALAEESVTAMICEWINDALATTRILARPLSSDEVGRVTGLIAGRYTDPIHSGRRLWEAFHGDIARRRSDGWSLICDYPEPSPILLFHDEGEFRGYEFSSPEDLRAVLAETAGFEFYVTNERAEFVLCHNHHDFLVGVGECRQWLGTVEEG